VGRGTLFSLAPSVSDARIDATLINFVKHMGRYVTYISEVTRTCVCVCHTHVYARTYTHKSLQSRENTDVYRDV
jgi:hypothetical protein